MTRYRDMTEEQRARRRETARKYRDEHRDEIHEYMLKRRERYRERRRELQRKYYAEHREERNERNRKRRAENRDKYRERRRKYYAEHREERKERTRKWIAEHREEYNERKRKYYVEHREEINERTRKWISEHREEYNEHMRKRLSEDLNKNGVRKSNIRNLSNLYLKSKHAKIPGYEIHHAFGYEDYTKFIYIPKGLHVQIHQLLRDNNITADSDHWMTIRDMVNSCDQYTYISV